MGGIAIVRACPKIGSINTRVGIVVREGIGALSITNYLYTARTLI